MSGSVVLYCVMGGIVALVLIFATVSACRKDRNQYYVLEVSTLGSVPAPPCRTHNSRAPPQRGGGRRWQRYPRVTRANRASLVLADAPPPPAALLQGPLLNEDTPERLPLRRASSAPAKALLAKHGRGKSHG